jgi:hypothetical protein
MASRVIPFKYSADVSFCLELGNQTMRFFSLGARVVLPELVTNGSMEVDANWTDSGTPTVNVRSSEQAHGGTYSRKFTVDAAEEGIRSANWTSSNGSHVASLFVYSAESSVLVRIRKGDNSGWAFEQTFTLIPNVWNWINFNWTENGAGVLGYITIQSPTGLTSGTWYVDDATVRMIYQISTPWGTADLPLLKMNQVGNVIYFAHPSYAPRKLTRVSTTYWTLNEVVFDWPPFQDENEDATKDIQASAITGSVTLDGTGGKNIFAGTLGAYFKLKADRKAFTVFGAVANSSAITLKASEILVVSLTGTWVGTMILQRSYDSGSTWLDYAQYTANGSSEMVNVEDNMQWRWRMNAYTSGTCTAMLCERNCIGYCKVTSVVNNDQAIATVIETLPIAGVWVNKWSEGAWSTKCGFPRALSFYEGRLVFASSEFQPATLWGSVVDDYENHETGAEDDKAWNFTLAGAEVNKILWMIDGDILHIGTAGDEWKFGDPDEPTTASSVKAKRNTGYGSSDIEAVLTGGVVLFIEDGARSVRAIRYNFETDNYEAECLTEKAEHLFSASSITEIAYTPRPVPIVWFRLADGNLRAITFDPLNKILAFHRHIIQGGAVDSICSIRGTYYDELWLVVRRTIDGTTVRYIEYIQPAEWIDKEDAFYVDGGLTLTASPESQYFTGLYHLEGETVNLLADGAVHPPVVVQDGAITLDHAVSKLQVGLAYKSVLIPKRLEMQTGGGDTCQSREVQFGQAKIRILKTMTCRVGTQEGMTDQTIFRTTLTPLGEAPDLFTGDKIVQVRGQGKDGKIVIECEDPTPLTVIAIMPITSIMTDH